MALPLLLLLSLLFPVSFSLSPDSILAAADSLAAAGFVSMSLTLNLTSPSLLLAAAATAATVFAPSDPSFADSGQPPLALLRLHLAPRRLPERSLLSLPHGAKIPTLAPDLSVVVTTAATGGRPSLNGVRVVNGSALFDDGSLAVYGVDGFLDPSFHLSSLPTQPLARGGVQCEESPAAIPSLTKASEKLKPLGYSAMAALLEAQAGWGLKGATVFAVEDRLLGPCHGNLSEFVAVLRRHVAPCRLAAGDLADLGAGAAVPTLADGFTISVDWSDGKPLLNGVPVTETDLFDDGSVVVHAVGGVLRALDASLDFGR